MEYGSLAVGKFFLITVTLEANGGIWKDARRVRVVWEQLIRYLKLRSPKLTWFKVVELTKKGTPHLHLIVGGLGNRVASCFPKGEFKYTLERVHQVCKVDCLIHEWGKAWFGVTGDSFVVDAREGYSAARLANYLGKYLTKGFYHRAEMERMGFKRRWSCARNWPSPAKLQTRYGSERAWERVEIITGYGFRDWFKERMERDKGSRDIEQVGDDLLLTLRGNKRKSAALVALERNLKSAENV